MHQSVITSPNFLTTNSSYETIEPDHLRRSGIAKILKVLWRKCDILLVVLSMNMWTNGYQTIHDFASWTFNCRNYTNLKLIMVAILFLSKPSNWFHHISTLRQNFKQGVPLSIELLVCSLVHIIIKSPCASRCIRPIGPYTYWKYFDNLIKQYQPICYLPSMQMCEDKSWNLHDSDFRGGKGA